MRKLLLLFLILFGLFVCKTELSFAGHLVGGEIFYDSLGNNQYKITLKIYRDCAASGPNVATDFDNPLRLGVFSNGSVIEFKDLTSFVSVDVPINSPDPCITIPTNLCVKQGTYTTILTLPPRVGGYDITYQRCCRNATISNLSTPNSQGMTNSIHIPGSETGNADNNSPRFTSFPPPFLCANTPFTFNHAATDPDGDVLVYSLCQPNIGADQLDPAPLPDAPPYGGVSYNGGFSSGFPIASNPAIAINSSTGQLTLTPTQLGQFVVGICVSEFRNGVLLSTNKRDFQFNVVSCNNVIASIPNQTIFCNGYQVDFTSTGSINAATFQWDFGVTSLTTDVSTAPNPTYFYPDSGVYNVRLIAISATGACRDTSFSTFRVYPLLEPNFVQPDSLCLAGNSFNFNAAGSFTNDATFLWRFGNGANIVNSTQKNNANIFYNTTGTKIVSLTISQYGCTETTTKTMEIFSMPEAIIGNPLNSCTGLANQLQNLSIGAIRYFWEFGVTFSLSDTSSLFQPNITYPDSGIYNVRLIAINADGCRDTVFKPTQVYHLPNPDFVVPPQQCVLGNNYSFVGLGNKVYPTSLFTWSFQDASPVTSNVKNPTGIRFNSAGIKNVTFTVNQKGCTVSKTKQVELVSMPDAGISDITQYCVGLNVDFANTSSNATSYEWDFGITTLTTDVSSLVNPSYQYPDSGKYLVTLVAINQNVCRDTIKKLFYVFPLLQAFFEKPENDCIDDNSYSFLGKGVYGTTATYEWNFTDAQPQMSTLINPQNIVFQSPGIKPVKLIYRENGCVKTHIDTAYLFKTPIAEFTSPTKICSPFEVQFENKSFAETRMKYLWDFGDGTTDTIMNPLHVFPDSGYYDISLTVTTDSGCIAKVSEIKERYVFTEYTPIANFEVLSIDTINYRPVFQFIDKSKFAVNCMLELGNGIDTTDCNMTNYQYPIDGEYIVKQIVTNSLGCKDEIIVLVDSKPELLIYIPNAFTPNGDGKNEAFLPKCSNETEFEMEIFNRWGQRIYNSTNSRKGWKGTVNDVDADLAPQGVYVYKIKIRDYQKKLYTYTGSVSLIR